MPWQRIEQVINDTLHTPFHIKQKSSVGGGCINNAFKISNGQKSFFVKTNRADLADMFEAEQAGLSEILNSQTIRAPQPVATGSDGQTAFLILEYLDMQGSAINDALFGQQLALMHQSTNPQFGWFRDNTIGSTPQPNQQTHDWPSFWHHQRLAFQLTLASQRATRSSLQTQGEQLLEQLPLFFSDYQPGASLLHGDLWSGNYSSLADGTPVIFDPAVYFGDRETDIAMTELFGGFSPRFYAAYREALPLDPGYQTRKTLYNLYHILNHFNLFGGGYLSQAEAMIQQLLHEVH